MVDKKHTASEIKWQSETTLHRTRSPYFGGCCTQQMRNGSAT
jgi:hypothetical protein